MSYHQVCIEAKIISCTDHTDCKSEDEAIEEALDDIRMDGYEIIDYTAHVYEYEDEHCTEI